MYWILVFKNEKKRQGNDIRRYTEADREQLLAMCQDDLVKPEITFGDIYKGQIQSAIVPLEEGVLETCFYERMVLIGDSWHKVSYERQIQSASAHNNQIHPLSGLGGNNAIMSAAALADELKHLVDVKEAVARDELETAFRNYQKIREAQVRRVSDSAHLMARMDTLDNRLFKFMQRYLLHHMGIEVLINTFGQMVAPAVRLNHLPLVPRHRLMPFNDETKIRPRIRSILANRLWVFVLASLVLAYYLLTWQSYPSLVDPTRLTSVKKYWGTVEGFKRPQLHLHMSMAVVAPIICLESYRQFFFMKLLSRYVCRYSPVVWLAGRSNVDQCSSILTCLHFHWLGCSRPCLLCPLHLLDRTEGLLLPFCQRSRHCDGDIHQIGLADYICPCVHLHSVVFHVSDQGLDHFPCHAASHSSTLPQVDGFSLQGLGLEPCSAMGCKGCSVVISLHEIRPRDSVSGADND